LSEKTAEKTVENIFEKIKNNKLLVIAVVIVAFSVAGVVLYLIFGRGKKEEAKKE